MKFFSLHPNTFIIRFDANEDVFISLSDYCKTNNTGGYFTCIGSTKDVTLSYYNLETKQYEDHQIVEDLEVVSITGNISFKDSVPAVHAHGVFSKRDLSTIGGHIKKMIVSATCEVYLTIFHKPLKRAFDQNTGLNLLSE